MNCPHTSEDAAILARTDSNNAAMYFDRFRDANMLAVWAEIRHSRPADMHHRMIATAGWTDINDLEALWREMRGAA